MYPGAAAPTKNESTGPVPAGSLAAESATHDGPFASNNLHSESAKYRTEGISSAYDDIAGSGHYSSIDGGGTGSANATSTATAPSYVENQYIRDPRGPYGKNISEGLDDSNTQDGTQKAFNAEPGSIDDPSREAEYNLALKDSARTRDAGPREHQVTDKSKFDALNSNTSA